MPDIAEIFMKHYRKNLKVAATPYASTFELEDGVLVSTDKETYLKEIGGTGPSLQGPNATEKVSSFIRVGNDGKRRRVEGYTRKQHEKSLEEQIDEMRVADPFMDKLINDAIAATVNSASFKQELTECLAKDMRGKT